MHTPRPPHDRLAVLLTRTLNHDILAHPLPPADLFDALIDLFFDKFQLNNPVLHRPSFLRAIASGTHEQDQSFRSLVFAVLAVASRFSSDHRVYQDFGYLTPNDLADLSLQNANEANACNAPNSSAGWAFGWVACRAQTPLTAKSTLADLQASLLLCHHLMTASGEALTWSMLGNGIRRAQHAGFHRETSKSTPSTLLNEESVLHVWE